VKDMDSGGYKTVRKNKRNKGMMNRKRDERTIRRADIRQNSLTPQPDKMLE